MACASVARAAEQLGLALRETALELAALDVDADAVVRGVRARGGTLGHDRLDAREIGDAGAHDAPPRLRALEIDVGDLRVADDVPHVRRVRALLGAEHAAREVLAEPDLAGDRDHLVDRDRDLLVAARHRAVRREEAVHGDVRVRPHAGGDDVGPRLREPMTRGDEREVLALQSLERVRAREHGPRVRERLGGGREGRGEGEGRE